MEMFALVVRVVVVVVLRKVLRVSTVSIIFAPLCALWEFRDVNNAS